MRLHAFLAATALATVPLAAQSKTLVYTYQGKPLELFIPSNNGFDDWVLGRFDLMPKTLPGLTYKIKVNRAKAGGDGFYYEGIDYCTKPELEGSLSCFFPPAILSFTSNYIGIPAEANSVIDLWFTDTTVGGRIYLDESPEWSETWWDTGDTLAIPLVEYPNDEPGPVIDALYRAPVGEWTVAEVPLPATAPLLFAAAGALMVLRRRNLATG
jgi:hypothetical protein